MVTKSRRLIGSAVVLLVAGCQGTAPPSTGASAPIETEPPLAAAGEAYVTTILDDDGPFFDVRVDAIAPTGATRPIASFADVHPVGWQSASPYWDMRAIVAPTRLVPVVAERNGGEQATDIRTLFLDLRAGGGPTVEIAGPLFVPFWGPDGQLATVADGGELIDLRTGARQPIGRPADVEVSPAWLADGSGWAAGQFSGEAPIPGWLSTTGVFTKGFAPTFQVTGLERFVGANGASLGTANSEGPNQSETVITESRADLPGPCHCLVWARTVAPGDDPSFGDAVWDASGTGIWIVFTKDQRRWLSHIVEPEVDRPVANLPPVEGWRIAGLSSDDRWVVVASSEARSLVLVDTASGAAREIARAEGDVNPAPMFGGWVR